MHGFLISKLSTVSQWKGNGEGISGSAESDIILSERLAGELEGGCEEYFLELKINRYFNHLNRLSKRSNLM